MSCGVLECRLVTILFALLRSKSSVSYEDIQLDRRCCDENVSPSRVSKEPVSPFFVILKGFYSKRCLPHHYCKRRHFHCMQAIWMFVAKRGFQIAICQSQISTGTSGIQVFCRFHRSVSLAQLPSNSKAAFGMTRSRFNLQPIRGRVVMTVEVFRHHRTVG